MAYMSRNENPVKHTSSGSNIAAAPRAKACPNTAAPTRELDYGVIM